MVLSSRVGFSGSLGACFAELRAQDMLRFLLSVPLQCAHVGDGGSALTLPLAPETRYNPAIGRICISLWRTGWLSTADVWPINIDEGE